MRLLLLSMRWLFYVGLNLEDSGGRLWGLLGMRYFVTGSFWPQSFHSRLGRPRRARPRRVSFAFSQSAFGLYATFSRPSEGKARTSGC